MSSDHLGARFAERELLSAFLDWYRAVVIRKVADLSVAEASQTMTATGLSPLGVVAHLAAVEYGWFEESFLGKPGRDELEPHARFTLSQTDTVASVIAEYVEACDHSRHVVESAASLDDLSERVHPVWGNVSLRWILVHMIEETARHAGHLDIMREAIDGRTGD